MVGYTCCRHVRWGLLCGLLWGLAGVAAVAQDRSSPENANPLTLRLPAAEPIPGGDVRVLTHDDRGTQVVGRLHVSVGDQRIVMLGDGQLVIRKDSETSATERPFVPHTAEQMAERLISEKLTGFRYNATNHYVYVYNCSDGFTLATSRILETMYPALLAYARRSGIEVHEPDVPLMVIMFRTEQQFQQFQRMPAGIIAYYNAMTNQVVMHEESHLAGIKPALALQQSVSTIAHEGVHQVLHNIGVQQRLSRWPMWLSEGLAEYFAATSTGKRWRWKGVGQVNDLRMFELEQYVKDRAFSGQPGQMVHETVVAPQLSSTGYACAWSMIHFLAKAEREGFERLLVEASRIGPLQTYSPENSDRDISANVIMFRRQFGDNFEDLERRLLEYLSNLDYQDPFAEFPHFVVLITQQTSRRPVLSARTFHTEELARKWEMEFLQSLTAEQRAATRTALRQFPTRFAAERFARGWVGQ